MQKTKKKTAKADTHSDHEHSHGHHHDIEATLRTAKLRVTAPREAILTLLMNEHGPFTAEEIHQRVKKADCDLVTVYRTLATLEKARMVDRVDFADGVARYEWSHSECAPQDEHHHHVICRMCRSIETVDFCLPEKWKAHLKKMGYEDVTHSVAFAGVCSSCQKKV